MGMEEGKEAVIAESPALLETSLHVTLKAAIVDDQILCRVYKMPKEDLLLPVKMGQLEIQPIKLNKNSSDENPFLNLSQPHQRRRLQNRIETKTLDCSNISLKHDSKHITICKRKHKRILREPILKILKNCSTLTDVERVHYRKSIIQDLSESSISSGNINLSALVANCNQLRISSGAYEKTVTNSEMSNSKKWWKKENELTVKKNDCLTDVNRSGPSCSQQALNPPCDVTIDELASYFDTLVHIPKKMSSMAEMMYI